MKKILPISKYAKRYKIVSILFVFYIDTCVTITPSLTKQHIKHNATFSKAMQNAFTMSMLERHIKTFQSVYVYII